MTEYGSGRELFGRLPRESPPPAALEEAVVAELRARGAFGRRRARGQWLPALAAALAGLVVGLVLAHRPAPARLPAEPGGVFMYIFSGGPQVGDGLRRTIEANTEWARTTLRGRILGGQKLLAEGARIGPDGRAVPQPAPRPDDATPTGFFLVRARDFDEAIALAGTCPLLEMGSSVTVRPVDDLRWTERTVTLPRSRGRDGTPTSGEEVALLAPPGRSRLPG
ncbi:MAG: hypothetical protein AB7G12_05095 [Thermoanaerobaculia bacterium]